MMEQISNPCLLGASERLPSDAVDNFMGQPSTETNKTASAAFRETRRSSMSLFLYSHR
jgi:hypothetical protein